jgi:DNA-binding MarR family transcriptional regulator
VDDPARAVLDLYPRIFLACHERHVRDPGSGRMVSEHQAQVLAHLDEFHAMSLTSLAAHMGVTAGTMSVAVSRLVRRGFVRRRRDRLDTRRVLLTLSASGARVRDAQSVLAPYRVRALLQRLSPGEQADAVRGLGLLARAAAELVATSPPRRYFGGRRPRINRIPEETP